MGYRRISAEIRDKLTADTDQNLSTRKLATKLGVSSSIVQYYRRAASKPATGSKPGRPRKTTAAQRKALNAKAKRSVVGTQQLAQWSVQHGYPQISRGTVAAVLKGGTVPLDYKPVKSGRVLSDRNKELRLQFAKEHLNLDFNSIIFIDQKQLSLGYDEAQGYLKRWQVKGGSKIFKKSSNPQKLLFYAAVAKGHKSHLIRVPLGGESRGSGTARFDSVAFIRAFKELWREVKEWFPEGQQFWVVMDSARQHTSKYSKSKLASMGVPLLEGFPPQSHDMNLIEVAWGHLQQQLQGRSFSRKDQYEKEVKEAWSRVKQSTIDKLVANHKQQLQKIKSAKGNWVDY